MKITDKKMEFEKDLSDLAIDTGVSKEDIFSTFGKGINGIITLLKFLWDIIKTILSEFVSYAKIIIKSRGNL